MPILRFIVFISEATGASPHNLSPQKKKKVKLDPKHSVSSRPPSRGRLLPVGGLETFTTRRQTPDSAYKRTADVSFLSDS